MVVTDAAVERWLREDLGHHDVVNAVPGRTTGRLIATEPGVIAGLEAAIAVFEYLDVSVDTAVTAGDRVAEEDSILTVEGPAQAVLRGERVAVNLVAHASGIATRTRRAVETATAVTPDVAVAATRKTTPGLRGLEKRAVAAGGGDTHRLDLSHAAMIKDNHIAEMGLTSAIEHIRERTSFTTPIEVEAESPAQARRAAEHDIDAVLIDNLPPADTEAAVEAVATADPSVVTEASGGIDQDTLAAYAATGVDVISMGGLTHSAPALDCSFRTG